MKFGVVLTLPFVFVATIAAAPADRITRTVDTRQTRAVPATLHRLAQPQYDRGAVDPKMEMQHMLLLLKPSASQQADLERLLTDQQNPSSAQFHQWLTPEDFGNRFGLSAGDHSKVAAWLHSEGFTINESARARNWIAFSGVAGQVSKSLHTSVHKFEVNGETHFANTTEASVPEALADVVGGFAGLNDFRLKSMAMLKGPVPDGAVPGAPDYTAGSSHYLAPGDLANIYDVMPLYLAGIDGTDQNIMVVGDSDIVLSDLRTFRSRFALPASDPKLVPYGPDPGINGDQVEANLDLEWAGAIAPHATLYYVYGPDVFTAVVSAVNLNLAPVLSISYGACEVDFAAPYYRSFSQQANAQGITMLAASGDAGPAGCDRQESEPTATRGLATQFPAVVPEITGVGGTEFVEGSGTYWVAKNAGNLSSALSYIPESAWNETGAAGLGATGGGASLLYPKPAWQTGPGVPADSVRHVPDVSLSAALHDAYLFVYNGSLSGVGGTSASAPSMAGIVALMNQYQVTNNFQKRPGLGNINPQLYRLAQSAPSAFHDIVSGDNLISCAQGSPDCLTSSLGYAAGPGYDMATGLGSIDVNNLMNQWNTATNGVTVVLTTNSSRVTVNDTVQASVTVTPASGSGMPTGTVDFSMNGIALGSVALAANGGQQTASLTFPVYLIGTGKFVLAAEYSGDAAFSAGGATAQIQIAAPSGAAGIVISGPQTVWPQPADAQGQSWQTTVTLREVSGIPAIVTGFTIDGTMQPLAQYFPSPDIPANGLLSVNLVFRGLTAPLTRTFVFTGVDANGNAWKRQIAISFSTLPTYDFFNFSATPLTVNQNPSADPSCQWAVQLNLDDEGGYFNLIGNLFAGGIDYSGQIASVFGTTRLDAWNSLQGKLCFGGITPPASNSIEVVLNNGNTQSITVSFAGPAANPAKLSAAPLSVNIGAAAGGSGQGSLTVNTSGASQPWTISVFPANRTTSWLTVSQLSGAGTSQIALKANGAGFEPGVYRANLTIESDTATPQVINVPVMFVLGGPAVGMAVGLTGNSFTGQAVASPGMLLSAFGPGLANSTVVTIGNPLPFSAGGVTATVNGLAAPLLYVSSSQINLQIPLEAGTGPAVLGINNNGQITGYQFQIAPAAPGIVTDSANNLLPAAAAQQGGYATLYLTGAGELSPAEKTGWAPSATAALGSLPKPILPLSVSVGGMPAIVQFAGLVRGSVGVVQVNFVVPTGVTAGAEPVIVTVGGIASPPANLKIAGGLLQQSGGTVCPNCVSQGNGGR